MDGMGQGSQESHDLNRKLSRQEASHAVTGAGWRLVLSELQTEVLTGSLPLAADVMPKIIAVSDRLLCSEFGRRMLPRSSSSSKSRRRGGVSAS